MSRASLGKAHSKVRFTKPFLMGGKNPQVHLNYLRIAVKNLHYTKK